MLHVLLECAFQWQLYVLMDEDCHLGEFESSLLCLALCIYKVFLGSRALHAHPNQGQDVELPFLLELQHLLPFQ